MSLGEKQMVTMIQVLTNCLGNICFFKHTNTNTCWYLQTTYHLVGPDSGHTQESSLLSWTCLPSPSLPAGLACSEIKSLISSATTWNRTSNAPIVMMAVTIITIFEAFIKRKILSVKTILRAYMYTYMHACSHTHTHTHTLTQRDQKACTNKSN